MKFDKLMINTAIEISKFSTCKRLQVGAIISRDNRIIATGFNGVAEGLEHCNKIFKKVNPKAPDFSSIHHDFSTKNELHAEQNAIGFCAKSGIKTKGCIIYITHSPCIHCAKLIIASGIKTVVYNKLYDRDQNFKVLFDKLNIKYREA